MMETDLDITPIVDHAVAEIARMGEVSPSLALLDLIRAAVSQMARVAGEENTRVWCRLIINDALGGRP